jgi:hypothetical protein
MQKKKQMHYALEIDTFLFNTLMFGSSNKSFLQHIHLYSFAKTYEDEQR